MDDHERFVRENIGRRISGRKRRTAAAASTEETRKYLERLVRKHGLSILEPYEQRLLARLRGEEPPAEPQRLSSVRVGAFRVPNLVR